MERVELAARLHDVGKLAIPDAILTKPAALDAAEWEVMRTHAEIGARIVASAPSLAHTADLIRSHHERYDGQGYPDGLAGEEIPIAAAIIAVCAAFVAMMRHRPYSDAITVAEALAELRRCSGRSSTRCVVDGVLLTGRLARGRGGDLPRFRLREEWWRPRGIRQYTRNPSWCCACWAASM